MQEIDFIPFQATHDLPPGPVLVLAPHPDDEVFGCAAAIRVHVTRGDAVQVVIATDGAAARAHPDAAAKAEYIQTRQAESRAAARVLGHAEPIFWDYADRELPVHEAVISRIAEQIQTLQARTVYAPSIHEIHPDHQALAQATELALRRLDAPLTLMSYEIGAPLRPNVLVDQTPHFDWIQQAVGCYASQLAEHDYTRFVNALHIYRSYTLPPGTHAAEAFYQTTNQALREHPASRFGPAHQTLHLETLQTRVRQLEQIQAQIETSHSWRITAPLRALRRWFATNV